MSDKRKQQPCSGKGSKEVPSTSIKIMTWNIRHGLKKYEKELRELLKSENVDVCFTTETDTLSQKSPKLSIKKLTTEVRRESCALLKTRSRRKMMRLSEKI